MSSGRKLSRKDDTLPDQKRQRTDPSNPNCGISDSFPYEVSKRIAQHVCSGKGTPSAIALGLTSKQQSLIVSDVTSGILAVSDRSTLRDISCRIPSMDRIAEFVLVGDPSLEVVRKVLAQSNVPLQKLSLVLLRSLLCRSVLQLVPELRELEISVDRWNDRYNFLSKTVFNKHLRKLKIYNGSPARSDGQCLIKLLVFPSVDCFADEIGADCCNLEELSLTCNCSISYCAVNAFDVTKVPHLRSLSLHTRAGFPDSAVTCLCSVESLSISGSNAVRIAGQIGSNVSAISNVVRIATRIGSTVSMSISNVPTSDIFSLQSLLGCPGLQILELAIKTCFSSELAAIVTELRSLQELTVMKSKLEDTRPNVVIEFAPGAVLGIAKALPALEKLHLLDTRISQDEIVNVLEELGTRLVSFEGSAQEQAEGRLERVESLLCAAIRFNPRLEHFDVPDLCSGSKSPVQSSEKLKVNLLMKRLQTVAPLVNMNRLSARQVLL